MRNFRNKGKYKEKLEITDSPTTFKCPVLIVYTHL
jgi:hypothetical protein